jgi:2-dehydropantoate 2-reductase
MRVLVIGAGALGGYFGALLHRAGRDVSFLVRPQRTEQIARDGLRIVTLNGAFTVPVRTVVAGEIRAPFDLVLVAVKAYSLAEAMENFAPAIGPATVILPILNGMVHLDTLGGRFGTGHVVGGTAMGGATLDADGRIVQTRVDTRGELEFGELAGGRSDRVSGLLDFFDGTGIRAHVNDAILWEMWEKWVQIAAAAGFGCLMRASVGDILGVPGGREFILRMFGECCAVATAAGYPPRPAFVEYDTKIFTTPSPAKASTLRDVERGSPTEGDHIVGAMVRRAHELGIDTPLLDLARVHLAAYEVGRHSK